MGMQMERDGDGEHHVYVCIVRSSLLSRPPPPGAVAIVLCVCSCVWNCHVCFVSTSSPLSSSSLKEFEPQSQSWSLRTSSFVRDFQWLGTSHKSCFGEYWAGVHGLVCTAQPTFITTARLGLEPLEGQSILGHAREATATFPPSFCSFRSAEKIDYS